MNLPPPTVRCALLFACAPFLLSLVPLQAAIDDNLVVYWKFEGDLTDETATGADATFSGSGSATYATGRFGNAIDFEGSQNQHAIINGVPESTFDFTGQDMSISVWIKVESFSKGWQAVVAKGEGTDWRIHRRGGGNNLAYAGGSGDTPNTGPNVNDAQWHHVVAVTEHGVSTRLWVDGVLAATGATPNIGNNSEFPRIGENPQALGRSWDGMIDDLAIWNRVLTPAEIANLNGGSLESLLVTDADADTLDDDWELSWPAITNLTQLNGLASGPGPGSGTGDFDGDGLTDADEETAGTDPTDSDSDNDGSSDGNEVNVQGTNPLDDDSDDDGLLDGVETNTGTYLSPSNTGSNPLSADTDADGLTDSDEVNNLGTNPNLADSDGDGAGDGLEIVFGTDPQDPTDTPPPGATLAGITNPGNVGGYLDNAVPNLTPGQGTGSNWQVQDALPALSFADLKGVASEPNSDGGKTYIGVVERRGTMQRVEYPGGTVKTQTLDIQSLTVNGDNGGLRTVVFHPEFNDPASPNKDYIYVFYSTNASVSHGFTENPNGTFFYRVSRFTRNGSGIFGSEQVMIQQMSRDQGQHFGGGMAFGKDGFLYISWGDMEFSSGRVGVPFYQDVQRIDRIFQGAVLCLDVDRDPAKSDPPTRTLQGNNANHPNPMPGTSQSCPSGHNYYHRDNFSGVGYYIPRQNFWHASNNVPPAGSAGSVGGVSYPAHGPALEEHVALGVRNPWRMAADPVDGDIAWFSVGSNGGTKFEEAEVLVQGGNYGWPYKEGDQSETGETGRSIPPGGTSFAPVYLGTEVQPVEFHSHSLGNVAVGGVLYQGTTLGSVNNMLINGDHGSGRIWSVDYKGKTGSEVVTQLIDTSLAIRQMAPSPNGEEVLIAANGDIYKLIDTSPPTPEPPALLSGTGAFTSVANLTPRAGMIPFAPVAPLWSDRSLKQRWIAVPNDSGTPGQYDQPAEKILFSSSSEWSFPRGTVFVKHFILPLDEGDPLNPAKQKRLETRFLIHGSDGNFIPFTYKWNANETDADLIPSGDTAAYDESFTITRADSSTYQQTWKFPSRSQCFDCHQTAASHVLGVKTRQMNSSFTYPSTGNTSNQLATMNSLGMFDQTLSVSAFNTFLTSANIADSSATLEHRVKSYLDSNCSQCHRPGGQSGLAAFDALLGTPLGSMGIVNVSPNAGDLGLSNPMIVKPGDVANSMLAHRDGAVDPAFMMPPLAKSLQHAEYMAVLTKWIGRIGFANFDAHATAAGILGDIYDDDDGDKLSNGLEFLLQMDGTVPAASPDVSFLKNPAGNEISFPIEADALADGLGLAVIDSTNLVDWFQAGSPGSILTQVSDTSSPASDGIMTWRFTAGERGFAKVGLTPAAP